jgi:predicted neuraminidase
LIHFAMSPISYLRPLLILGLLPSWLFAAWRVERTGFIERAPEVPEVHASTVVEAADGSLVAAWFGGSKEGNEDIAIWVAGFDGQNWSRGRIVATGEQVDGRRFPTWNPVLHRLDDGAIALFLKVGPSPESWWGEVMISRDSGRTWGERRKLPEGVLGPIKNKAVRLADGTILSPSSFEYDAKRWSVRMERTDAHLKDWSVTPDLADPQGFRAIQPSVLVHPDGRLQALCRTSIRQLAQTWSDDGGRTWSPLEPTGLFIPNSGIDAVALREGGFLMVYNPSLENADPKSWGERRPLVVAHSMDGRKWQTILTLETAPNRQGYSYPAIIQAADGRVHLTYTWNRARIAHAVLSPN